MQVEEVKKKVTFEILSSYVKQVQRCGTLDELAIQSKTMFKQVAELVLPKIHIEYVNSDMPQDILNEEERKDQMTSEQKLIMWLKHFTRELKATTDVIEQELSELTRQKETVIQLIKDLAKQKEIEQATKGVLDLISKKIEVIEKQTNQAKAAETDLMANIDKIFKESTRKMKEAEVVIVVEPKRLSHRLTQPYLPITQVQDRVHPAENALNYDNYIVAVRDSLKQNIEYNFLFKDGTATQYTARHQLTQIPIQPADKPVKRIVIWYHSNQLIYGFQLFAKDGTKLYQTGYDFSSYQSQETVLEDDERIIGIKARKYYEGYAQYADFQFVIGRMV